MLEQCCFLCELAFFFDDHHDLLEFLVNKSLFLTFQVAISQYFSLSLCLPNVWCSTTRAATQTLMPMLLASAF